MLNSSENEQLLKSESENKSGGIKIFFGSLIIIPLINTGIIAFFCSALTGKILNDDPYYYQGRNFRELANRVEDVNRFTPMMRNWGIFFYVVLVLLALAAVGFGVYAAYAMLKNNEPRAIQIVKRALNINLLCSVLIIIVAVYSVTKLNSMAISGIYANVQDTVGLSAFAAFVISLIYFLIARLYLRFSRKLAVNYQYERSFIRGIAA